MFFLYGAGGHAKVVLDILHTQGVSVDCVCDDNSELREFCGLPVIRGTEAPAGTVIISVGKNEIRQKIAAFLRERGNVKFATAVHPSAIVSPSARIGAGTVVMPGVVINAGAEIGEHSIVNTGASIDHDCRIGDFVHVAPHATLCGNIFVGNETWIGAGTTIIQGISIGKNVYIGAGSVVVKNLPENILAYGNPCKAQAFSPPPRPNLRVKIQDL